jgi:hypothetical protein
MRTLIGSKGHLPSPHFKLNREQNTLVVISSWGGFQDPDQIAEQILSNISLPSDSADHTIIRGASAQLSFPQKHLKRVLEKTNKELLANNNSEYKEGFEILVFQQIGSQVYFCQVGGPQIFAITKSGDLMPLSAPMNINQIHAELAPLPVSLLGAETDLEILSGNFSKDSIDQVVFLYAQTLPKKTVFFEIKFAAKIDRNLCQS